MKNKRNLTSARVSIQEAIRRFYDAGSPVYFQLFGEHLHDGYYITGQENQQEAQQNLIRFLVEKSQITEGARILDVGCGLGGSSIWLAKNLAAQTVGITISPVQLEMAVKLAREQGVSSEFLLMDAENMEFTEPFDFIWVVAALTHFQNQENFFKSAARFLEKPGKLIIYDWTVGENVLFPDLDSDIKQVRKGMVLSNLYSASTYEECLSQTGYRILYSEDITAKTIQTWDFPLHLIKDPAMRMAAVRVAVREGKEIFNFLYYLRAMKRSMQKGKIRSTVIIAEKI